MIFLMQWYMQLFTASNFLFLIDKFHEVKMSRPYDAGRLVWE